MKQTILYLGRFGNGESAACLRARNIARQIIGKSTRVIIASHNSGYIEILDENVTIDNKKLYFCTGIKSAIQHFTGKNAFDFFLECKKEFDVNVVVLYNETYALSKKVLKYAKKNDVRVYSDVTEWYEFSPIIHFASYILTHSVDKRIRELDKYMDGVMTISEYMHQYYLKNGIHTVRIPPIMSHITTSDAASVHEALSLPIRLVYAGSPGTKDLLVPVFDALEMINQPDILISFHLYGLTEEAVKDMWKDRNLKETGILCFGKIKHEFVTEEVKKSHFTVLFRKRQRYALAGYSTKVSESLSLGTPVICNRIGGTDADISDGKTGFILDDCSVEKISEALYSLLKMDSKEYAVMRLESLKYAKEKYSGEIYSEELKRFFEL